MAAPDDGTTGAQEPGERAGTEAPGRTKARHMPRARKKRQRVTTDERQYSRAEPSLDASLFINRELSWLEFNQRVLEEAKDERHPLLERVKFLAIVSSNLDEFFMIRVAAIKEQLLADILEYSIDGRTPAQQMQAIHERVMRMLEEMRVCFWNDLHPKLWAAGVQLLRIAQLETDDRQVLADLFAREIYPVLTPLAFDPGHPFPYISNLSLSLAVVVGNPARRGAVRAGQGAGRSSPAAWRFRPRGDGRSGRFVWLEDLIAANLGMLFPGMTVQGVVRVPRHAKRGHGDPGRRGGGPDPLDRGVDPAAAVRLRRAGGRAATRCRSGSGTYWSRTSR